MQIEKVYEPGRFEPAWAQWWVERGIFKAAGRNTGHTFAMVIPPPNVTGVLHMGHMVGPLGKRNSLVTRNPCLA